MPPFSGHSKLRYRHQIPRASSRCHHLLNTWTIFCLYFSFFFIIRVCLVFCQNTWCCGLFRRLPVCLLIKVKNVCCPLIPSIGYNRILYIPFFVVHFTPSFQRLLIIGAFISDLIFFPSGHFLFPKKMMVQVIGR